MPGLSKEPTYHRLNAAFKLLGPYLREEQYQSGTYQFDCLAVCVDDKKSPEVREFWGWWMSLSHTDEQQFEAKYAIGRYDHVGNWVLEEPQPKALAEVHRTQKAFHEKLETLLNDKFGYALVTCDPLLVDK
ncbi:sigma factor-binding protein Crl [Vibrio gazogenes]|uniref:Sigma factor-binding protein Crl n=1 Tax=Vibrio gazogenes DSM 21264 = NBRC 103151 TaxID=1123492 RepID=A0A1M4X0P2_VIBGA|nr:sigma factor-binding protein Crl [Vibrio gazogenes]USP13064.1 sigma factor-binding protein Crl [Vibrio gazogenes]SHE86883.1 sigma factor-binding protein Crl [Vibrio gazogenes DSM 21264] [Vibrio gazogenes DSM 21264 = NBRC 103151]SJN57168.1 Sigma factor-binding protein Crl [Vibrio gazogenes]